MSRHYNRGDPDRIARVIELWKAGLSYSQIGERLGVNRNIPAGIICRYKHKNGLGPDPQRSKPERNKKPKPQQPSKPKAPPPTKELVAPLPFVIKGEYTPWVPLVETETISCRYEDHGLYCNAFVGQSRLPYCAKHIEKYYPKKRFVK